MRDGLLRLPDDAIFLLPRSSKGLAEADGIETARTRVLLSGTVDNFDHSGAASGASSVRTTPVNRLYLRIRRLGVGSNPSGRTEIRSGSPRSSREPVDCCGEFFRRLSHGRRTDPAYHRYGGSRSQDRSSEERRMDPWSNRDGRIASGSIYDEAWRKRDPDSPRLATTSGRLSKRHRPHVRHSFRD
jgi:hypothetical protein